MTASRRRRGRDSELAVAAWLRDHGYPHAEPTSASAAGCDLTGVPWAVEIKARRTLDLPGWMRQATRNADTLSPLLIVRGNGQGVQSIGEWAAIQPLSIWLDGER